jgi:hypothetical protein
MAVYQSKSVYGAALRNATFTENIEERADVRNLPQPLVHTILPEVFRLVAGESIKGSKTVINTGLFCLHVMGM